MIFSTVHHRHHYKMFFRTNGSAMNIVE